MTRFPRSIPAVNPTRLSLRSLSPERRRLVEIIHEMGFGTIRDLKISDGEPIFTDSTEIIRQVKFQGTEFYRPESMEESLQRDSFQRLLAYLDQVRDVRILISLEAKHGLPFLGDFTEIRN